MRLHNAISTVLFLALAPSISSGQDVHWQRKDQPTEPSVTIFHSPQSANLPTATVIGAGQWQFEISHRFLPPFSDGAGALWGLDGPIYNRLGLSYAPTDRLMVHVVRSNLDDNLELGGKVRVLEGGGETTVPFQVALAGGFAWNTAIEATGGYENNESQAYAQLVVNTLVGRRLAIGVVPSLLHNPTIADRDAPTELTVGLNGELYLGRYLSLLGEWNVSPPRGELVHDAVSLGLQIETGGHFFKLVATNSARPNPTQFLGGTPYAFKPKEWRFGFNVTRLLAF